MRPSTPIINDAAEVADALAWARVAGLVEINPNGSWNLTPQGLVGARELLGQEHPFDASPIEPDRRQLRYLG